MRSNVPDSTALDVFFLHHTRAVQDGHRETGLDLRKPRCARIEQAGRQRKQEDPGLAGSQLASEWISCGIPLIGHSTPSQCQRTPTTTPTNTPSQARTRCPAQGPPATTSTAKKGPGHAYALPNPLRLRNSANERARSAPSPDQCSRLSGFNLDVILAEPMNMGTLGYRQGHRYLKAGQDRISSRARGSLARDPSARSAVDSVGRGSTLFLPSIRLPMDRSTLRHSKSRPSAS